MRVRPLHDWDLPPEEAAALQRELRAQLILTWDDPPIRTIAGVDVGIREERGRCAIVVLSYPALEVLSSLVIEERVTYPYIPGLLTFREGPLILKAWERLTLLPDVVMFDGQGIAHPRGMGIAAHMGLWLEKPTLGVAKSRLWGEHAPVGEALGDLSWLYEKESGATIGAAVRTRPGTRPVYVSPGHRMDLPHAIELTLATCRGYRLPEPLRLAHRLTQPGGQPPLF
jgi:deoxyribonuclease V